MEHKHISRRHLAFRHVIQARGIVARQRERVEMLTREGHDTTEAKRTLDIFEDNLRSILEQDWIHNPF